MCQITSYVGMSNLLRWSVKFQNGSRVPSLWALASWSMLRYLYKQQYCMPTLSKVSLRSIEVWSIFRLTICRNTNAWWVQRQEDDNLMQRLPQEIIRTFPHLWWEMRLLQVIQYVTIIGRNNRLKRHKHNATYYEENSKPIVLIYDKIINLVFLLYSF